MTVKPLKRMSRKYDFCWCGCIERLGGKGKGGTGGIKSATHVATILGHDTKLCGTCAKQWKETYESALEGFPEEVAA